MGSYSLYLGLRQQLRRDGESRGLFCGHLALVCAVWEWTEGKKREKVIEYDVMKVPGSVRGQTHKADICQRKAIGEGAKRRV